MSSSMGSASTKTDVVALGVLCDVGRSPPSIYFRCGIQSASMQPNAQWVLSSVTLLGARQRRETFLVAFGTDDRHKIGLNSFAECRMQLPPR